MSMFNVTLQFNSKVHEQKAATSAVFVMYKGWNFNSGNYLFTTDTK